jgi:hypothetical protein
MRRQHRPGSLEVPPYEDDLHDIHKASAMPAYKQFSSTLDHGCATELRRKVLQRKHMHHETKHWYGSPRKPFYSYKGDIEKKGRRSQDNLEDKSTWVFI